MNVATFSGGVASWCAARRIVDSGIHGLWLLFADTLSEAPDSYRFLLEAAADIATPTSSIAHLVAMARAMPEWHDEARRAERRDTLAEIRAKASRALPHLVWLCDGRDPWEVIRHERFLGRGKDPCSKILKRELLDRWFSANCAPESTVRFYGLDWTEGGRAARLRERLSGWRVACPLEDAPYLDKAQMLDAACARGIAPPSLYADGFSHANCSGFCVKAGHGHFARLLSIRPAAYLWHEANEEALRAQIGDSASIMSDRRGGERKPLTMRAFRARAIAAPETIDRDEIGGCGCAVDDDTEEAPK